MTQKQRTLIVLFFVAVAMFSGMIPSTAQAELRLVDARKGDNHGDLFGDACEGLGDINGDGYADFLTTIFKSRELLLYFGGPHPFDSQPVLRWSNHSTDALSFSPVNVGDMDCDGVTDFVSLFGRADTLKLFLGLENLDSSDFKVIFADSSKRWYFLISGGGDNDNDGWPELWIDRTPRAIFDTIWGYKGCDALDTIADYIILLNKGPDNQYSVIDRGFCTTGDLNGDGIPDIVYGQPTSYSGYPGRVNIIWGGPELSQTADLVFYAPLPHAGNPDFGRDLACLGDISGDGIDDLWVSQGGRNYIYHGGQPFDTFPDLAMDWSYMKSDVEAIGDINGDGWPDIMLVDNAYLSSRITYMFCYPGMDTLVDGVFSDGDYYEQLYQGPMCCFGIDHSWAGDIDGDGIDDALISARDMDSYDWDNGWLVIQAGWDEPVAVDDERVAGPDAFQVRQNYPNPFNTGTTIQFTMPRAGYTEVRVYDLLGRLVSAPYRGVLPAGEHGVTWDGRDINGQPTATGVYIYLVKSEGYSEARKMILLK